MERYEIGRNTNMLGINEPTSDHWMRYHRETESDNEFLWRRL